MVAHVLFDRPFLDQDADSLPLRIAGVLPGGAPFAAYEGRLDIVNAIGACSVDDLVDGTLPAGYSLEVDNDAAPFPQIVVRWPAFEAAEVPIPNFDFEDGNTEWELGYGWEIGTTAPPTPPPETGLIVAKYLRKGESLMRMAAWTPCAPGQQITARARINPVNKRSGSRARIYLEWYDSAFNRITQNGGSLVEFADEWEWSTVAATAPAGTAFVKIAILGNHDITGRNGWETRPILVDRVEWNYAGVAVGTNAEGLYCITLRARDSAGRSALWSGCINVAVWDKTWSNTSMGAGSFVRGQAAYSPNLGIWAFLFFNNAGVTIVSSDGTNFTTSNVSGPVQPQGLAWSEKLQIFCTTDGASNGRVYTSTDGLIYSLHTISGLPGRTGLCWSDDLEIFCIVSTTGSAVSSDGVTWTVQTASAPGSNVRVTWSKVLQKFVTNANTATFATSPDGVNWTPATLPFSGGYSVAESIESGIVVIANTNRQFAYCIDGVNWINGGVMPGAGTGGAIGWAPGYGLFIASGSTAFATSPDGIIWTESPAPPGPVSNWDAMAWSDEVGRMVTIGTTSNAIAVTN